MASVYGHGLVNLAATSSADSQGGLFFERDVMMVQPFAAHIPGSDLLNEGWYVWKDDGRWGDLADEPLNRRGWVLQERLLSPRTIHFTSSEVIWQCLEDLASESIPDQTELNSSQRLRVQPMEVGDYTDIRIAVARARHEGLSPQNEEEVYEKWMTVVSHFSNCRLTKETDKLVAIYGMVRQVEELTGDTCLAGLWRSHIPRHLVWAVNWGPSKDNATIRASLTPGTRPRPERWRAPSWSWASLDLPVGFKYHPEGTVCQAELVEGEVERTPNGAVLSAKLIIKAPLVAIRIETDSGGRVISGWRRGWVPSVGENASAVFYVQMDDMEGHNPIMGQACLILEDPNFAFFILLHPASEPSAGNSGDQAFRRVGALMM